MDGDDFRNAAALYRHACSKGKTIGRTSDCLIATVCIREECAIPHNDRDFDHLAAVTDLVVHVAPESARSEIDQVTTPFVPSKMIENATDK